MPIQLIRNDITRMQVDAIVNAANPQLAPEGGVCGAIHRGAGAELAKACKALGGCTPGKAKITKGYLLPARYVIHAVGPVWYGGWRGEDKVLASCYRESLLLARQHQCRSVAFPLISAGIYGFPKEQALKIATDSIRDFLLETDEDMLVYLILFDADSMHISEKLYRDIAAYIDDRYAEQAFLSDRRNESVWEERERQRLRRLAWELNDSLEREADAKAEDNQSDTADESAAPQELPDEIDELMSSAARISEAMEREQKIILNVLPILKEMEGKVAREMLDNIQARCEADLEKERRALNAESTLDQLLQMELDESFSQMVLRKIDEKGMTDPECYKRANLDRKLFSKIRNDIHYQPSKRTALALAIALELPLPETEILLRKAGLALSHSNKFDVIVEYFITRGKYDLFEINQALFDFDQVLLGG